MEKNSNLVVSVIITTYNREKTLRRAIDSVLAQTYFNIELIIIDNGSTDGTKAVVQSYAKNSMVRYVYWATENGYINGLNSGINTAKGKYIAILDDDDFWCDKDKVKKQVDFLERNIDYILVGGGAIKIDQKGEEVVRYLLPEKDVDIRKKILISNPFVHISVLYKKDAWEKVGGYDESLDWGLWLKMGKIGKFYNIQEFFANYTGHQRGSPGYIEKKYGKFKWLRLNLRAKKKYKNDYPGYVLAVLFCWLRYLYSILPFRRELWPILFKINQKWL